MDKKMRDLSKVIDACLEVIPTDQPVYNHLKDIQRDIPFKAPEIQIESWQEFTRVLNVFMPSPESCEWAQAVYNIIMDEENSKYTEQVGSDLSDVAILDKIIENAEDTINDLNDCVYEMKKKLVQLKSLREELCKNPQPE
jgi:hypothetical protein